MELPLSEIQTHESSYVDPNGFVFLYGDKIYRGLRTQNADFYRSLFEQGVVRDLVRYQNLVESEPTVHSIPEAGCPFVIEHRKIEPLTYCVEWTPSMLKDAALSLLELNIVLQEKDCVLQDAYPWNILFEATRPIHVDFTSIVPVNGQHLLWPAYQQFLNFFIHPLKLASMGKGGLARFLLQDYIHGVSLDDVHFHMSLRYKLRHPLSYSLNQAMRWMNQKAQKQKSWKVRLQSKLAKPHSNGPGRDMRVRFLKGLLKKTEAIQIPSPLDNWVGYYEDCEDAAQKKKMAVLDSLLGAIQPKTVLDLGCNRGRYSLLAARKGARVISMDASESCVEALYHTAREGDYAITPVVGNALNPTPAFGFLARQFPSMISRFKSEVVLCLALMHHLHINGRQSMDRIARLMDALSERAVIFEYVDPEDDNVSLLDHGRSIDYNLQSVSEALSHFFKLTVFDSDRETRKIILCEKQ